MWHTPIAIVSPIDDIVDIISEDKETVLYPKKHTFSDLKKKLSNNRITQKQCVKFEQLINDYGDVFALDNSEI